MVLLMELQTEKQKKMSGNGMMSYTGSIEFEKMVLIVRSWRRKDRMLMMVSTSSMALRMGRW